MTVSGVVGRFRASVLAVTLMLAAFGCGDSLSPASGGGFSSGTAAAGKAFVSGVAGTSAGGTDGGVLDDGVDCTLDNCDGGTCTHIPRHFLCSRLQFCSTTNGCVYPEPCFSDAACQILDGCVVGSCDLLTQLCNFRPVDADGDGAYPPKCGGDDCNDDNASLQTSSPETCDGKDNDCDGVVDPPNASGCTAPFICTADGCACPNRCPGLSGCADLLTDVHHCGSCDRECSAGDICSDGQCTCPPGQLRCDAACVDPKKDFNNCGQCGTACGIGQCVEGTCVCTGNQVDCDAGPDADCRSTDSDPAACGGCNQRCLPASGCVSGSCDAEVQLVKMYGGVDTVASASQLVMDATGNLYAALTATGEHRALPAGATSLWSSANALIKLDKNADFLWAAALNVPILDVKISGSDVWIAIASDAAIQVGETSFALADQHVGLGLLLKLSGSTGAILDSERFDFAQNRPYSARLLPANDGVWIAFSGATAVDYLGTTSEQPGDPYYSMLFHRGVAEPRWLPGDVLSLAFDDNGKIVVGDMTPGMGLSVSFGGDTFTTAKGEQSAAARYTKDLQHEASFVLPVEYNVGTALPLGDNVLFVGLTGDHFVTFDFTGQLLTSVGNFQLAQLGLQHSGSKVSGYGSIGNQAYQVGARDFAQNTSYFVAADSSTGEIEQSFGVASQLSNGIVTGISGFAGDPSGGSVTVAVFFDGTFEIGSTTYGQAGNRGVAFVQMKLRQP